MISGFSLSQVRLRGGTGFYIDLVTNRIKPALIEPNMELRKELSGMSLIHLQDILRKLNLAKFEKIDKSNPVRLIRAIEIEKNHTVDLKLENKDFRLIGLPFFNEGQVNNALRERFEKEFNMELIT